VGLGQAPRNLDSLVVGRPLFSGERRSTSAKRSRP
jgi:hypothetical protein